MADKLRLEVILSALDKVTAPLKRMGRSSASTGKEIKQTREELKRLNEQQAAVANVQKQAAEFARLNNQLKIRQSLLATLRTSGTATNAQLAREEKAVRALALSLEQQKTAAGRARAALNGMGVAGNLTSAQQRLQQQIESTTKRMAGQREELGRLAKQQERVQQINAKHGQNMMHVGMAGATGYGMYAGGQRGARGVASLLAPGNKFDTEMSSVQALTRLEGDSQELKALRDQARKLGAETMFSATQAAQGQSFLAMAGFKPKAIMDAMPGLLDMSKAGKMDLGRGADIASNILSGFAIDPSEMGSVADTLTKVFTTSNVNLEMLGNTMSYVAPVARAAGVDLQTTAAMAGLLGNVGIQGEKGGTALRAMLLRMAAPTGKASAAFKELGVETADAEGNMRNTVEVLADIAKATEKMGNATRMEYMKTIFGEEPAAAMTELITQAGSGGILKYLAEVRDSQGAASKTAKIMADNLTGDWDEITSAWEDVRISIFDANKAEIRDWAKQAVEVIRKIGAWFEANPQASKWFARLAVGMSVFMAVSGALLIPLALVVGKMMLMRFLLARLGLAMFGTRAAGSVLAGALGKVGTVFGWMGRVIGMAGTWLLSAGRFIFRLGGSLLRIVPMVLRFLGPWGMIASVVIGVATAIWANWDRLGPMFAGWWTSIKTNFMTGLQFFAALPGQFMQYGADMIAGLVNGITGRLTAVRDAITGAAETAVGWFKEKLGINSPSRVFMELGGWVSKGAADGIEGGAGAVRKAALAMAAGSMVAMSPAMAAEHGRAAAPVMAPYAAAAMSQGLAGQGGAAAGGTGGGGSAYTINIQAAPGMDPQAIAKAVAAELDRREREKSSRRYGALADID